MFSQARNIAVKVTQEASRDFPISVSLCLLIQTLFGFQSIALAFGPLFLVDPKEKNQLSHGFYSLISCIEPIGNWSMLSSNNARIIAIGICFVYFVCHIVFLAYISYKAYKQTQVQIWVSKLFTMSYLVHSRVIFYIIHCFLVKALNSTLNCNDFSSSRSIYCQTSTIVAEIILIMLNLSMALAKEMWFYQVRRCKSPLGMKENFYTLSTLLQKVTGIFFLFLLNKPQFLVGILNFLINLANLYVLHSRLSFYNTKILRASLIINTCLVVLSIVCLLEIFNIDFPFLITVVLIMPLVVKMSLIKLNVTFKRILKFQFGGSPYRIAHLPVLLSQSLKKFSTVMTKRKTTKQTFYFSGLLNDKMMNILNLKEQEAFKQIKYEVYLIALEHFFKFLKKHPNNEMLQLLIGQIYIKNLKDAPKALNLISRLKTLNLTIPLLNSVEDICFQLKFMYHKADQTLDENQNYLRYFALQKKIGELKREVQKEIFEQVKFWYAANKGSVDVKELVDQAHSIKQKSDKVELFWKRNFEGRETDSISASILYGLYISVVQGLFNYGVSMIEKSFRNLNQNKDQYHKDISDILIGNSVIVVSSIELDKLGKVIDVSASVKKLFEIEKPRLLGSSINLLMPKIIAKKHNNILEGYHNDSRYELTRKVRTYAKTINDSYFCAEVTIRLQQTVHHGINLMACIRKISNNFSLIIVDFDGKIIECSKDVKDVLNLNDSTEPVMLTKLCPDFSEANRAFNIAYQTNVGNLAEIYNDSKNVKNQGNAFQSPLTSKEDLSSVNQFYSSQRTYLPSPTDINNVKLSTQLEQADLIRTENSPFLPKKVEVTDILYEIQKKEDAMEICNTFKEGKALNFFAFNTQKKKKSEDNEYLYDTQIEPYFFCGETYKIIKLKQMRISSKYELMPTIKFDQSNKDRNETFADDFPKEDERKEHLKYAGNITSIGDPLKLEDQIITKTVSRKVKKQRIIGDFSEEFEENEDDQNLDGSEIQIQFSALKSKTSSIIGSQIGRKPTAKDLMSVFRKYKASSAFKTSLFVIHLIFLAVIVLTVIDYNFKADSLRDMQNALNLVDTVHKRLGRTTAAWLSIQVVYARSIGIRPVAAFIKSLQTAAKDASLEMLANSNILKLQVNNFGKEEISKIFFEKSISLWDPYQNKTYYGSRVDSFMANQVLVQYGVFLGNYPSSVLNLKGRSEVLFVLNNTGNDYLLNVEAAINHVEDFLDESKQANVHLLILLLISKLIALALPFILIVTLFRTLVQAYRKLLKAASTIENHEVKQRIDQLQNFKSFLDKNVEENITSYNLTKFTAVKLHYDATKSSAFTKLRNYQFKQLFLYIGKYFLFVTLVAVPVVTLFWITFSKTYQGLNDLEKIKSKMLITSRLGSQISLINPNFYFLTMFQNDTSFKIRNRPPAEQLLIHLNSLETANNLLLSTLSTPDKGIDDPFVEDILKNNLCRFLYDRYFSLCLDSTNNNSLGILGLNSKYSAMGSQAMKDYLKTPTFTKAQQVWTDLTWVFGTLNLVLGRGYDLLPQYFLSNFMKKADEQIRDASTFMLLNILAIVISLFLISATIIRKLRVLDKRIREILRLIPFEFIERNKALKNYLSQEFRQELKGFRGL